jgi:TPR repeat protein
MAAIWDDRLAEVWATPGKAGAGVVIGTEMVLTARHLVAGAFAGGSILSRVVKPGAETADWVPMAVLAEDSEWDVALLGVRHEDDLTDREAGAGWLEPSSPQPVFVSPGTSAEHGCEAVGFPQSEVQRAPDGDLAVTVRQSEHVVGTVLPAGQAKKPVNPARPLPRRWVPLDVDGPTPGTQAGWGGMSGAGVVLSDGRLVGLVVNAESGHQQRRLYMILLSDVLAESGQVAGPLAAALQGPVVVEAKEAPLYRDVLHDYCLAPDGMPVRVRQAGYRAFGVKAAGVPGEPSFLDYVPRHTDKKLRDGLQEAQAGQRMLLIVGGSASGKSRSAAEAARLFLPGYRLLCPKQTLLARVRELPIADLGPAVVWLDDVERYDELAFRDIVEWLLRGGIVVVATIRRTELQKKMPVGDLRNPLGEALTDRERVVSVSWPVAWSDQDRARVAEHVSYPPLVEWVMGGESLSAWVVAGPALEDRLKDAEADDERPVRYAVVRTVLDWYRTGITKPIPAAVISDLLGAHLSAAAEPGEVQEALEWAFESVTGASRSTSQSLLAKTPTGDAITLHDYIQDADARSGDRDVADAVWTVALDEAISDSARFNVGIAAFVQANNDIAYKAWLPLGIRGDSYAMFNLGWLIEDSDPDQARRWYKKAAAAGDAKAMNNLGVQLKESDPDQARQWFRNAAFYGEPSAMFNLGKLLQDSDPDQARHWYEKAVKAGHAGAMFNLGKLLQDSDPDRARRWYEKAVKAGHAGAMFNLGKLLQDSDPNQARRWYEKAAAAGDAKAMTNLGKLLEDSDPDQAQRWYEKAAKAGDALAMFNLGVLAEETDPDQSRRWYKKAVKAGHAGAMANLGKLLEDSDPHQARRWYERAAAGGDAMAMTNLGVWIADSDPAQARRWFKKAAKTGDTTAMTNIGQMLKKSDPAKARRWFEKAAKGGDTKAMTNLGTLSYAADPDQAQRWFEKAASAGNADAMFLLGLTLREDNPDQARHWFEKAADAGNADAMYNLGMMFNSAEDPDQARRWWEKAANAGNADAMISLGVMLHRAEDLDRARHWLEKAANAGHADAMYNLGVMRYEAEEPDQAGSWFEKAANAGNADAMYNLGVMRYEAEDPDHARHWLEKAANAGNADAMYNLGVMLYEAEEPDQAGSWFEKAANAGQPDAMHALAELLKDSDPAQARRWLKKAAKAGHALPNKG